MVGGGGVQGSSCVAAPSPGHRRKRRSSSLLFTRTFAFVLCDLAGVSLLGGDVRLRGREVGQGMEVKATLPLVLVLAVVRVLEAVTHGWGRERSSSGPRPVRREGGSTAAVPATRGLHGWPANRRGSWR